MLVSNVVNYDSSTYSMGDSDCFNKHKHGESPDVNSNENLNANNSNNNYVFKNDNDKKMFNKDIKMRFVDENYDDEKTRRSYIYTLSKVEKIESFYNKDVAEFNLKECEDMLASLNCRTKVSLGKEHCILKKYKIWVQGQGYFPINNSMDIIFRDDLSKYINKTAIKNQYVTREELYKICDDLYNYRDQALLVLLYEGVRGRADSKYTFEEIRNLKKIDCDFTNNILTLRRFEGVSEYSGYTERRIQVSQKSMDIIQSAINEDMYHKNNGMAEKNPTIDLKDTQYVIRTASRKNTEDRVPVNAINTLFVMIKRFLGEEYQFLSPTNIFKSGMLEKCREIELRDGYLGSNDYMKIHVMYGMNPASWYTLKELCGEVKNVSS